MQAQHISNAQPLKRSEALKPLSREHHYGLLFCWKLREGLRRKIAPSRLNDFINWHFVRELFPHFEKEETFLFPLAPENDPLVQEALRQHAELRKLFFDFEGDPETISAIEQLLQEHIRFEERLLFTELQKTVNAELLEERLKAHHDEDGREPEYWDPFWKRDQ